MKSFYPLYLVPGIVGHAQWLQGFRAAAAQKTFKVLDPMGRDDQVHEIDVSLLENQSGEGDSTAERAGWTIDCRYSAAPDVVLFTNTYATEDLAKNVMDDLSRAASEVEGLIRKADFEGAQEAMKALSNIFKSASAEPPVADTDGGAK